MQPTPELLRRDAALATELLKLRALNEAIICGDDVEEGKLHNTFAHVIAQLVWMTAAGEVEHPTPALLSEIVAADEEERDALIAEVLDQLSPDRPTAIVGGGASAATTLTWV